MQIYLVGGAVRDQLLNIPTKDNDWVVVGSTPEELVDLGFQQVGADFPVFLHPQTQEEHALARTERKSGSGYQGFICDFTPEVTLEQDLIRRDLTINAMAQDHDGNIIDPFNGQQDLQQKILRHVSPAFSEDPLRVLRVARFAARFAHLGFAVAEETMDLMSQLSSGNELSTLTPERVWQETQRALTEQQPWIYFEVLQQCGALKTLMPEIDQLFGVPQPEQHHPEIDCGIHMLLSLKQAAQLTIEPEVRWAVVCHDLGKGITPEELLPKHHGHEQKGKKLVSALCKRLKCPKDYAQLAELSCMYHTHVHRAFELRAKTIADLFSKLDVWRKPERFEQFLTTCIADARGRTGHESAEYPQADYLCQCLHTCLNISNQEIIADGFQGKAIGEEVLKRRIKAIEVIKNTSTYASN